eukprot:6201188-Pleurochrysis_carterae.AAC.1
MVVCPESDGGQGDTLTVMAHAAQRPAMEMKQAVWRGGSAPAAVTSVRIGVDLGVGAKERVAVGNGEGAGEGSGEEKGRSDGERDGEGEGGVEERRQLGGEGEGRACGRSVPHIAARITIARPSSRGSMFGSTERIDNSSSASRDELERRLGSLQIPIFGVEGDLNRDALARRVALSEVGSTIAAGSQSVYFCITQARIVVESTHNRSSCTKA